MGKAKGTVHDPRQAALCLLSKECIPRGHTPVKCDVIVRVGWRARGPVPRAAGEHRKHLTSKEHRQQGVVEGSIGVGRSGVEGRGISNGSA